MERWIGVVRLTLVGAATPALIDGWDNFVPYAAEVTTIGFVILAVSGIVSLLAPTRIGARLGNVTGAIDVAVLLVLAAAEVHQPLHIAAVFMVLPVIIAGMRYGAMGGAAAFAGTAGAIGAWATLRASVLAEALYRDEIVLALGVLGALGLMTGALTDSARRQRDRAERTARELEILNRMMVAGLEGIESNATLRSILRETAEQLDFALLAVMDVAPDGEIELVASSDETVEASPPSADPGGPIERAAHHGETSLVTDPRSAGLSPARAAATAVATAPIRTHGRITGVLVAETVAPGGFPPMLFPTLERLASQIGLVLTVAGLLAKETALAERYRELDRMKTDFVAMASHELRTPLTAIVGFTETLQSRPDLAAEIRPELLDAIGRNAGRLERLVDDLRTVSMMDRGQLDVRLDNVDVDHLVADVHETTASIVDLTAEGTPGLMARVDPYRMHQVLANLLRNAVDHADGRVSLDWHRDGDEIAFAVTDSGPGIPPAERDKVFERFSQGGTMLAHSRGSGLGLAISRELVEAMGGRLSLDPAYTSGARFLLRIPAATRTHARSESA